MSDRPRHAGEGVRLRFPASPWEVRQALAQLLEQLPLAELPPDLPGELELVMAEVLNNVVEHAYRGTSGMIEMQVSVEPAGLRCRVIDFGAPLKPAVLPDGRLPEFDEGGPPEGGFGWFLITALAQEITYQRIGASNRLSFLVAARAAELPRA